ncbi:MAG: DinB family protein, partial [Anaerolineales bacterium]
MTNLAFEPALDQLLDYRAQLLARLEGQPAELAQVLAAIPEADWHLRRPGLSRTVHRTLAHVRDLELLAFLPRVQRIQSEDEPVLAPFISHDWSLRDYLPSEPLTAVLASWAQTRAEVMNLLPGPASPRWT